MLKIGCEAGTASSLAPGKTRASPAAGGVVVGGEAQAVVIKERAVVLEKTTQRGHRVIAEVEVVQSGEVEELQV